ncbi:helix-turn-helix transcriptional regulator [Nocardia sp. NEAU-G5]|uniref:Helix-turn-helix transcriptional regulator n=1 Tax=Nocardia albiluteola TaxID=2842303 RepID=A0ABS6B3W1_9NOCA|nr:helix-turn-helix domain-containing protein [Nocardia albiluteola]MBU3064121.1 helix-turn-helix transcriptional regulator [Nocardia albiluteola]
MRREIEYCPVSAGIEVIGDRWTLLLVRELLVGSHRFNDIHRGLPGISRTLLSTRLRRLQAIGLVARVVDADGRPEYRLTQAGAALESLVWQLGDWARQWSFGDPRPEQLDPGWALWRLRQFVRTEVLPAQRVCVEFILGNHGHAEEHGWLVCTPREVSACLQHPGYDTDLWVTTELAELYRLVAGTRTIADTLRAGRLRVVGEPALASAFPGWFAWRTPASADRPPAAG